MGGKTTLVYSERFQDYYLGPSHPLRPIRVKLTYELIRAKELLDETNKVTEPRVASEEEIFLFHERDYVRLVQSYSKTGIGLLDAGDTPAFKGCFEATSLVVGASLEACDKIMTGEFDHAFNPSGGLHHAHPERASGFCIFNDPAISINYLKKKYNVHRLLYLDIDAHHGDGVMYGFYDDPGVLDIDFHESGLYLFPGTGSTDELGEHEAKGLKLNVPLPPGTGDESFLRSFHKITPDATRKFRPEIILVQCGVDGHENDRLANLRLTEGTYAEVVSTMHSLAHELCGGRMILFGGGGYTLSNVPRAWTTAFGSLANKRLDNVIPDGWSRGFVSQTGEAPPIHMRDKPTTDDPRLKSEVDRVLEELTSNLHRRA